MTVTPIGFGAFKIGRNEKTKYAEPYPLPDEAESARLLNGVLDMGVNYIDTAPAYGLSEERIGRALAHRRAEFTLSTKVGENFVDGQSSYDFSAAAVERSIVQSLSRLKTEVLDLVFIHSPADDLQVLQGTDAVPTLLRLRERGLVRRVGLSAKTLAGAEAALVWADALMLEYHLDDQSLAPVMLAAAERGVAVVVKKALASGKLSPAEGLRFVMQHPAVTSAVVGTLNLEHLRENLRVATATVAASR